MQHKRMEPLWESTKNNWEFLQTPVNMAQAMRYPGQGFVQEAYQHFQWMYVNYGLLGNLIKACDRTDMPQENQAQMVEAIDNIEKMMPKVVESCLDLERIIDPLRFKFNYMNN